VLKQQSIAIKSIRYDSGNVGHVKQWNFQMLARWD